MSLVVRLRAMARRALGTPDATNVASAIDELRGAIGDIGQSLERIERLVADEAAVTSHGLDDTRRQLDQLRGAVLEHAESLDRIAGQDLSRPPI